MDESLEEMTEYIKKIESENVSNKTKNYINSFVKNLDEYGAIMTKYMFYNGYAYGWNDLNTFSNCAGKYPSDEKLKE